MALPPSTGVERTYRHHQQQAPHWQYVVLALLAVLALLLVIALAIGWVSFDLTSGNLRVDLPSVDADVNAPDVDVQRTG